MSGHLGLELQPSADQRRAKLLMIFRRASVVVVVLFLCGCVSDIVPATGERRYLGYTWQQETDLGKRTSKEVTSLFGPTETPILRAT